MDSSTDLFQSGWVQTPFLWLESTGIWISELSIGHWVLIALGLVAFYLVVNAATTVIEHLLGKAHVPKTEEQHWKGVQEAIKPIARLCAQVYEDRFGTKVRRHDFHAKLIEKRGMVILARLGLPYWRKRPFCHVLAKKSDGYAVIVFRGSRGARDWVTNFQTWKRSFYLPDIDQPEQFVRCRVHSGFAKRLDAPVVRGKGGAFAALLSLVEKMDEELGESLPLYLAGHSLGGALAVLAAARFLQRDADQGTDYWSERIEGLLTFGQPAFSNRAFRKHFNLHQLTHRICVGIDIVTFLPPFISYRHVGRQYWIHDGEAEFNNLWVERLLSGFSLSLSAFRDDHDMIKYLRQLPSAADNPPEASGHHQTA